MSWTAEQRRTAVIASAYGYKTSIKEQTIPVDEISVGDGVIVLTDKGEPIMSGTVSDKGETPGGGNGIKIGDEWYCSGSYSFRRI